MRWSGLVAVAALVVTGCATVLPGEPQRGANPPVTSSTDVEVTTLATDDAGPTDQPAPSSDSSDIASTTPVTVSQTPIRPSMPLPPTSAESSPADPGTGEGGPTDPLQRDAFQGSRLVDAADFPGVVSDIGFQTPSGNIICGFYSDGVACQILEYDYTPPEFDCGASGWGFNFGVDVEGGFMFCAGDVEGGGPTLEYGEQIAVGDYHCVSREDGVTCVNAVQGGGFALARAGFDLF